MKKAFVLLSGCGNRDGTEIREAVLSLLALDMFKITPICIAPKVEQRRTINHWESLDETVPRMAMIEAARLARGDLLTLESVNADEADLLVIPGGQGASTTLCSYAIDKTNASVLPSVKNLIVEFFNEKKPIVAICISPILIALSLQGKAQVKLTLGQEKTELANLANLGMLPISCSADSCVVDTECKIITTPAYMEPSSLSAIWKGIHSAIEASVKFL